MSWVAVTELPKTIHPEPSNPGSVLSSCSLCCHSLTSHGGTENVGPGTGTGNSWAVSTAALPLLAEASGHRTTASCRCWTGDWPCSSETVFRSQWCWQWNGGGCHFQLLWAASVSFGSPDLQDPGAQPCVQELSQACSFMQEWPRPGMLMIPFHFSCVCTIEWPFQLVTCISSTLASLACLPVLVTKHAVV